MWGIIIAIISGILMSVQGVFNTQVSKVSGIWTSAAFVQASALVVFIILATGFFKSWACILYLEVLTVKQK